MHEGQSYSDEYDEIQCCFKNIMTAAAEFKDSLKQQQSMSV